MTLGHLGSLPLEILHEICFLLDIDSLYHFLQVNLRARQIVCAIPGYRSIMEYALGALGAVLRTKIATWFTLSYLFSVLRTRDCTLCGSFGGFIFLLSFMRCCFPCLETAPKLRVISLAEARRSSKLTPWFLLKFVPVLKTIPEIYLMDETPRKKKIYILAEEQVTKAFRYPAAREARPRQSPLNEDIPLLRYMAATALPYHDPASGDVQYGVCCKGCQIALEK